MTDLNLIPRKSTENPHRDAHGLSRREFIKLTALLSGNLGLWLSGCSPGEEPGVVGLTPLEVVDEWIRALNGEDAAVFEKLHSPAVFWTHSAFPEPFSGREQIWDLHRYTTGSHIGKVVAFSQDQSVCLLVNATRLNRSHCFVFNVRDDLIDGVYGYDSRSFDLARSPHFSGIDVSDDDSGLQDRLDAMDALFVDGLNNRDFSDQPLTASSIWFNFNRFEPHIGYWETDAEGMVGYVRTFPSVHHERIQTFGQGNLVCSRIVVSDPPGGSLCFVSDFQDGKITTLYEFRSAAIVNS